VRRLFVVLSVLLLLGAAPAAATQHGGAVVKVAFNKSLKKSILVSAKGMTLYFWTADTATHSACVNDPTYHCSKDWPPLLTTGDPHAGSGAKTSLLGSFRRDDGGTQVTYAGHPLYTFAGYSGTPRDRKPGDLHGQGYIGLWWVLSPTGKKITKLPHT
jgi:predicted lipoprotein with Yx(FWY)xxD motif